MSGGTLCRDWLAAKLREGHATPYHVWLRFEDLTFRLQTNERRLAVVLSDYYQPFLCPPGALDLDIVALEAPPPDLPLIFHEGPRDPGKKLKEEFADLQDGRVVRKRLTGMVFVFGAHDHLAIGPCLANPNQVVNFINNRFIQLKLGRGSLLGHASAVLIENRGLALAGFSGMGKSTLALHLLSRGATFVSNDRLMVSRAGDALQMRGVPKYPRINPGTALHNPNLTTILPSGERERLRGLSGDALWQLEQKYDVPIEACFGPGLFRLHGPLHALVILNWHRRPEPLETVRVDLRARRDLLAAFMKSTGLFYLPPDPEQGPPEPEEYLDLLAPCRVMELTGGVDFEGACRASEELLADGGAS